MKLRELFLVSVVTVASLSTGAYAANCCPANGQPDCNSNCVPDVCDIDCGATAGFCSRFGLIFAPCILRAPSCGGSSDCNGNGVPDECDPDCNCNGIPDGCDVDNNSNGITDVCESVVGVIYVDADAAYGGTGTSWSTAFNRLQDALKVAEDGNEIWIAGGTYNPDQGYCITWRDRSASFVLKDGVDLYGGFEGTESVRTGRVLVCSGGDYPGKPCDDAGDCPNGTCGNAHPTILSGDLDDDDAGTIGSEAECDECPDAVWADSKCTIDGEEIGHICENSLHVVTYGMADAAVILDGLTIRDGYANQSAPDNQGAGLHIRDGLNRCLSGGPTVSNCIFDDNWSSNHGGVNDHASASSYTNCVFKNSRAAKGAGLLVDNGSPTIDDCLFLDNKTNDSPHEGGGVWLSNQFVLFPASCPEFSTPAVTDSDFVGNVAMEGGAIWSEEADPTISGCAFTGNTGTGLYPFKAIDGTGGAIFLKDAASPTTVATCTFTSNDAEDAGAGIFIVDSTGVTVEDCTFFDNSTFRGMWLFFNTFPVVFSGGGAIWNENSPTTIQNCVFDGNEAGALTQYGGAVFNKNTTDMTLEGCTFTGNRAGYGGGAVWEQASDSTHTNCVYVGNRAWPYSQGLGGAIGVIGGGSTAHLELENCTLVDNDATKEGGGVQLYSTAASVTATNCIFWQNEDLGGIDQDAQIFGVNADVTFSIWEGYAGVEPTIQTSDPLFTLDPNDGGDGWIDNQDTGPDESANDDFGDVSLTGDSPAIDAGDNSKPDSVTVDLDGSPRRVDDENRVDTGVPADDCPYVDFGAYEYQAVPNCCDPVCTTQGEICCAGSCLSAECCSDGDCGAGNVCGSGQCEQCFDSGDCDSGEVCCNNRCQECCSAADCPPGQLFCIVGTCCCG